MKEIDGLENRIFEVQPYVLGGTAGTLSQAVRSGVELPYKTWVGS